MDEFDLSGQWMKNKKTDMHTYRSWVHLRNK